MNHAKFEAAEPLAAAPVDVPAGNVPCLQSDGWALLRDLTAVRARFGLNKGDLSVLRVLMSFVMRKDSVSAIVFARNETLCSRADGMAERTLRHHLQRLAKLRMIHRRDSPNGKRYARRDRAGRIVDAYGIDLSPLFDRADEISHARGQQDETDLEVKRLRDRLSLLRMKLEDAGTADDVCEAIRKERRRAASILVIKDLLRQAQDAARNLLDADDLAASDGETCRHLQKARRDKSPEEPSLGIEDTGPTADACAMAENGRQASDVRNYHQPMCGQAAGPAMKVERDPAAGAGSSAMPAGNGDEAQTRPAPLPALTDVLQTCRGSLEMALEPVRSWTDLQRLAWKLGPMIGLTEELMVTAGQRLGLSQLAVAILCLCEMVGDIRSPGGYLRALAAKAEGFRPTAMLRRLQARLSGATSLHLQARC